MLARLFVIFGGLFVLTLCAALVGPYFIDWSIYKSDFEREASIILGRKVMVEGDITARILPFPSVMFSDVTVGSDASGEPTMTMETFSMDVELAPFMRGEFLIFDMRLVRPVATIDVAVDGTVDWAMWPPTSFDARQISIEKLTITDGKIYLHHEVSGREHVLSDIDTIVSAKALTGPWRVAGALKIDGILTQLSASMSALESNGKMRLRVHATPERFGVVFDSDGNVSLENGYGLYLGSFTMVKNQVEQQAKIEADAPNLLSKTADPSFRVKGKFALDHARLGINEFRFETGSLENPYTADGIAEIDLGTDPHFLVAAKGAHVRIDKGVGDETGEAGPSIAEIMTSLGKVLVILPRLTIPGTVDVDLPAVVANNTTVRDIRLKAEPSASGWELKLLTAQLPGRARLEANGFLNTKDSLGFNGQLLLTVGQPSGLAAWMAKDIDEAVCHLPAVGLKAKVVLKREQQRFDGIELILGKAKFTGVLDSLQLGDARSFVRIKLDGSELDLEELLAFTSLFVTDRGANRFVDTDLDIAVKAGPVNFAGLSADTLDTELRLREGVLKLDKLSISGLAGASLSATGTINGFLEAPTGKLDASIVAVDLAPLVSIAAKQWSGNRVLNWLTARANAYPDLLTDARIDFIASAYENSDESAGLTFSATGQAGGSDLVATLSALTFRDQLAKTDLKFNLAAGNSDATALLALGGLPVLPLGMTGQGELEITAKGTIQNGLDVTIRIMGDDASALFAGKAAMNHETARLRGRATLKAADIEPWLMTAGVSLPGIGTGTSIDLTTDAEAIGKQLVLSNLSGKLNDRNVAGDLKATFVDGVPNLTGTMKVDELDLRLFVDMLLGTNALAVEGQGWPKAAFVSKSIAPFYAEVEVIAGTLLAEPLGVMSDASLGLKFDDQSFRLPHIKGKIFGSNLEGLAELKNHDGTALLTSQLKLDGVDVASIPATANLGGKSSLSVTLSGSGKSVEGLVASLAGSGTVVVDSLKLPGFNPDAFSSIIAIADALGHDVNAARVSEFATTIAGDGSFIADQADVAFTLAAGILRASPLTFKSNAATLTADLRADLNAGTVAASGTIAYAPGNEAIAWSEPMLNFHIDGVPGATTLIFDSAPLTQFLIQHVIKK